MNKVDSTLKKTFVCDFEACKTLQGKFIEHNSLALWCNIGGDECEVGVRPALMSA